MGREIERKFLVDVSRLPPLEAAERAHFHQGYLAFEPAVRVRLAGERAWLTIKGRGTISRDEFEYTIPADDARAILRLALGAVEKTRYRLDVGATHWELDQFHGAHDGLWLAEVELAAEDAPFDRPGWLGREVSDDPTYTNAELARAASSR